MVAAHNREEPYSLTICRKVRLWLESNLARQLHFVHVPSRLEWGIHHRAHLKAKALKVNGNRNSKTYLEFARNRAVESMVGEWNRLLQDPQYAGNSFLRLGSNNTELRATHLKGGP